MAKSEHGLSARSGATKMQISREEYDLNWALASGKITFKQFEQRYKQLLKEGKIYRSGRHL